MDGDVNVRADVIGDNKMIGYSGGFSHDGKMNIFLRSEGDGASLGEGDLPQIACELFYPDETTQVVASWIPHGDGGWIMQLPVDVSERPLLSVLVDVPAGISLEPDLRAFLAHIFPVDDAAFEKIFIRSVQRYGAAENQFVTARQISRFFHGKRAYRASASVVMAYKAMELLDEALQLEALAEIEEHLAHIEECEITWHPRANREHLLTSLLCAKWHLALSLGREAEFRDTLWRSAGLCKGFTNYFTPAYNLSISLLMLCVLLKADRNDKKIRAVSKLGFELFQSAVKDAQQKRTLFKELEVSHKNACFMMDIVSISNPTAVQYDSWVKASLRVRGESRERLASMFHNFVSAGN